MIRAFTADDMNTVINLWLAASIDAHDFVEPDYWHSKIDTVRNDYLPASSTWVYCEDDAVKGFYSLLENKLAALFVDPKHQQNGIGSELLQHAIAQQDDLHLTVYAQNFDAVRLYKKHGFTIQGEQVNMYTGHPEFIMTRA